MNLKLSGYNIIIDEHKNGDLLIYNSFTSALGILENKNRYIYDNIHNINVDLLDNEELECLHTMKENGIIIDHDFDEYNSLRVKHYRSRYASDTLVLTIAPTMACNLSCPYCYEKNVTKSKAMDDETQGLLIEFIEKKFKSNNINMLTVAWYGGEPLLALEVIRSLSKKIIELCSAYNIEYFADIVTNGTLLDRNAALILKEECKVTTAQVTIDGLENTHNQRRGLNNKENSFNKIIQNIDNCFGLLDISIRINVDKDNMDEIMDLINYFNKIKNWNDKVKYYFAKVRNHVSQGDSLCLVENESCMTPEEYFDFAAKMYDKMYESGNIKYFDTFYPTRPKISCSAITESYYVVDPQGDIYTCWILIGNKNRAIGNLRDSEKLIDNNSEKLRWLSVDFPTECKSCILLPLCQGGCPLHCFNGKFECRYSANSLKYHMRNIFRVYEEQETESYSNEACV